MTAKVLDETWFYDRFDADGAVVGADVDGAKYVRLASASRTPWNPEPHSVARLASAAPDMARVLLAIEWQWRERSDRNRCPSCDGDEPDGDCPRYGHRDNCALDAALRKAGVR